MAKVKKKRNKIVKTLRSIIDDTGAQLRAAGFLDASARALDLVAFVYGVSLSQLFLILGQEADSTRVKKLEDYVNDIVVHHKPFAYVLGEAPFGNNMFYVDESILIPRFETEWWVHFFMQELARVKNDTPLVIVDMCSGSGCIGLTVAQAFPMHTIYCVDISPRACMCAARNKERLGIDNVTIVQSDLFNHIVLNHVDIILSNPPYLSHAQWMGVEKSVGAWEDYHSLVSDQAGQGCIATLIKEASSRLAQSRVKQFPTLWIECDMTQGEWIRSYAASYGFEIEILKDQYGRDRLAQGTFNLLSPCQNKRNIHE